MWPVLATLERWTFTPVNLPTWLRLVWMALAAPRGRLAMTLPQLFPVKMEDGGT
jgi:hypothetical protein